jgi:Sec-independent protein secretion pathway component TatC
MFYLVEVFLRFKYLIFSFSLLIAICFIYNKYLMFLFIYPIITYQKSLQLTYYFIYTNPTELFVTYSYLILFLSTSFLLPNIFWQFRDFLKTSSYQLEYKKFNFFYIIFFWVFILFNIIFPLFLIPKIWLLFEKINILITSTQAFQIFYELKINEYFSFLFIILVYLNISLVIIIFFFSFLVQLKIQYIITLKKIFYLINSLIATFLSPPDLLSQFFLFSFLSFFFEIILLCLILQLKNSFNMVKY